MSHSSFAFFSKFKSPVAEGWLSGNRKDKDSVLVLHHPEQEGIVKKIIQPGRRGRVQFRASLWFAVCPYQIILLPETAVLVVGYYTATTLVVEPLSSTSSQFLPTVQVA